MVRGAEFCESLLQDHPQCGSAAGSGHARTGPGDWDGPSHGTGLAHYISFAKLKKTMWWLRTALKCHTSFLLYALRVPLQNKARVVLLLWILIPICTIKLTCCTKLNLLKAEVKHCLYFPSLLFT